MSEKPVLLVVDDTRPILSSVKRMLGGEGILVNILTAGGVQEAKEAIRASVVDGRSRISAVLTDWNMDDGSGADVVAAARAAGISSVGVMTGMKEDNEGEIRATDVQLILEKPFSADKLRAAVTQLLEAPAQE